MTKKRILVVDDTWDILFLLSHSIKRLDPDYEIVTLADGEEALAEIEKKPFDLIIADHMMPSLTGLELIEAARKISPHTGVILMTAYQAYRMGTDFDETKLDGYISKPFELPKILALIERVLSKLTEKAKIEPQSTDKLSETIKTHLKSLHQETGVEVVLLFNINGEVIYTIGDMNEISSTQLATFITQNFVSASQLNHLFDNTESGFKSIYYEGNKFNIYSLDINGTFFVTLVFDADLKPAPIWVYTKQAVITLTALLKPLTLQTRSLENE